MSKKTAFLAALALTCTATALPKGKEASADPDAPPPSLASLDDPSRAPFTYSAVTVKAEPGDGAPPKGRYWLTVTTDTTSVRKQTKQESKKSLLAKGYCFVDGKKFVDKTLFLVLTAGTLAPGETAQGGTGFFGMTGLTEVPKKCEFAFGAGSLLEDDFVEYAKFCWDGSTAKAGSCR